MARKKLSQRSEQLKIEYIFKTMCGMKEKIMCEELNSQYIATDPIIDLVFMESIKKTNKSRVK